MRVYLSGPISGKDFEGATCWRDDARRFLEGYGVEVLDPMRGKASLQGQGIIEDQPAISDALVADAAIYRRDHWDVERCDAMLVNLAECDGRVSIGTCFELAWAWQYRKVVILVMPAGNVHEHAFVRQAASMRVKTLNEGLILVLRTAGVVHTSNLGGG